MNCEEARSAIPLFLYGELSFDDEDRFEAHLDECPDCRQQLAREKLVHRSFDEAELDVTPEFLTECRQQFLTRLDGIGSHPSSPWLRLHELFHIRWHVPSVLQPVGALALVAMGFFGARLLPPSLTDRFTSAGVAAVPLASRVRYVEPGTAGQVQIVVEETNQKTLHGSLDDEDIQKLLLTAAKDPQDPGLRAESVDLLKSRPQDPDVRDALLSSLQHDSNAGVRLKALDGLKGYAADPQVRKVLSTVLLTDQNPGVRTQVIDLLIQRNEQQMAGVLQQLMDKEDNNYVRMRCQKALHQMKASTETF